MKYICATCRTEAEGTKEKLPDGWHRWKGPIHISGCCEAHFLEAFGQVALTGEYPPKIGIALAELCGEHEMTCRRVQAFLEAHKAVIDEQPGHHDTVARELEAQIAGLAAAWRAKCDCGERS